MKKNKYYIIFGSPDFEELIARKLLKSLGFTTATATYQGSPCTRVNAEKADGYILDDPSHTTKGKKVILFECGVGAVKSLYEIVWICDHHKPGDRGFDLPPKDFWKGSSIGQLCSFLNIPPTKQLLYTAANDHCPAHAYQGKCPGIVPKQFRKFRLNIEVEFNKHQGLSIETSLKILEDLIQKAEKVLKSSGKVVGLHDVRSYKYPPKLKEAAYGLGVGLIAKNFITENGIVYEKISCGGYATPEMVIDFMAWAKRNGFPKIYGNPTRGFAGARRVFVAKEDQEKLLSA